MKVVKAETIWLEEGEALGSISRPWARAGRSHRKTRFSTTANFFGDSPLYTFYTLTTTTGLTFSAHET